MRIRPRTADDDADCLDLLRRVHALDGYPLLLTPDEVDTFWDTDVEVAAWVAVDGERVVGHVALHSDPGYPTIEVAAAATGADPADLLLLARLFVAPDLRRTGLGAALHRHATAEARARGRRAVLDVGQHLHAAVALHEALGWTRVGELHLPLLVRPEEQLDLFVYVGP